MGAASKHRETRFFCQIFPVLVGRGRTPTALSFRFSLLFVAYLCFCWDFKRDLKKNVLGLALPSSLDLMAHFVFRPRFELIIG